MEKQIRWYAMGCPYCREEKAAELLTKRAFEYFLPVVPNKLKSSDKGIQKGFRFLIRNLIFVRSDYHRILDFKRDYNHLIQFIVRPMEGKTDPICVPDHQMEDFKRVCRYADSEVKELTDEELSQLRPNARVRITDGKLKGVEGYYQQIRRLGKKRVFVVKVDFLCGCATTLTECTGIEFV